MIAPGGTSPVTLSYDGYATVAVLFSTDGGVVDWIGER
jgi:hypothetical protein